MAGPVEAEDLPLANVKRVVKSKLAELAKTRLPNQDKNKDLPVQKEALLAFSESAKIFIHYLSATANDICKESKRQTINADDVFKALDEIEFGDFIDPLKSALEGFRKDNEIKKSESKKKGSASKRKTAEKVSEDPKDKGISESSGAKSVENGNLEDGNADAS